VFDSGRGRQRGGKIEWYVWVCGFVGVLVVGAGTDVWGKARLAGTEWGGSQDWEHELHMYVECKWYVTITF
jgi:hypothetical protein